MSDFMTDAWVERYAEEAASLPELKGASARIQYVIDGTAEGKKRWFEVIDDGVVVEAGVGKVKEPDCTITWKLDIAEALFAGEYSHDVAFMRGRTKVEGDYPVWIDRLHPWHNSEPVKALRAALV